MREGQDEAWQFSLGWGQDWRQRSPSGLSSAVDGHSGGDPEDSGGGRCPRAIVRTNVRPGHCVNDRGLTTEISREGTEAQRGRRWVPSVTAELLEATRCGAQQQPDSWARSQSSLGL